MDASGVTWRVWRVARQSSDENAVRPELRDGWLCFESAHEKRRLPRVPDGWEHSGKKALDALCREATPVPRRAHRPTDQVGAES